MFHPPLIVPYLHAPIPPLPFVTHTKGHSLRIAHTHARARKQTHICEQFEKYLQRCNKSQNVTFLDEAFMAPSSDAPHPSVLPNTLAMSPLLSVPQGDGEDVSAVDRNAPPTQIMHPQSLCSELMWVANWFQRVVTLKQQHMNELRRLAYRLQRGAIAGGTPQHREAVRLLMQPKLFVVDRSPYSAVLYTREGRGPALLPSISATIDELREQADVHIYTVCLKVSDIDILWDRISTRLKREPARYQFGESCRAWMQRVYDMYDTLEWDFTLTNDGGFEGATISDIVARISEEVQRQSRGGTRGESPSPAENKISGPTSDEARLASSSFAANYPLFGAEGE